MLRFSIDVGVQLVGKFEEVDLNTGVTVSPRQL